MKTLITGTMLAAGERLVVAQDSSAMLAAYPTLQVSDIAGIFLGPQQGSQK